MPRLDKIIAGSGFGTRKEVKQLLRKKRVSVDGEVIQDGAVHVDPENSVITVDGEPIQYREFIYLMMNKPAGVVSATYDSKEETVLDLVPAEYLFFEPFPVGRLDKDTEGLLLLTNDGALSHRLLSPKRHVAKVYYAQLNAPVGEKEKVCFQQGITLDDGYVTLPAKLEKAQDETCVYVTVHEGKFHQVKRMFEALGNRVEYLQRVAFGPLNLDEDLELGEVRELTKEEIDALSAQVQ